MLHMQCPHWVRDYPEKKSPNALAAQLKGNSTPSPKEPQNSMGTLQRLGALKSHSPAPTKKRLMYVSLSINGQVVRALLDTGATHNFIQKMRPSA